MNRVTWTGLNLREVTRVCRDLLALNAKHPTNPSIWFVGRSRIAPEANTVTIRTANGLAKVRVGDTIVQQDDGTFAVERSKS